jgi:hypothetical protein
MLRRTTATTLGLLILCGATRADAGSAVLTSAPLHAIEQRIAIALGPERTTVWTSLRFEADAGPVGVVIPVPPGASLDKSSDAWFEALEVATAPRVFPPDAVSSTCPGEKDPLSPFDIVGTEEHVESMLPDEVVVLADAPAVSWWADVNGLTIAPEMATALGSMSGKRFLAARFKAPGAAAVTPTFRVVLPSAEATLPLALVRATEKDLLVTTWVMGPGISSLAGATPKAVPAAKIIWNAKTAETSYEDARAEALSAAGPTALVLECAGHEPLSNNVPIDDGTAAIEGVITTFFERAAGYGDGSAEAQSCIAKAASALASITPVAESCPRAELGVVDGSDTCVEQPGGYTDPAALRCGDGADDLSVALSGLVPSEVWLTRQTMLIAAGSVGADWELTVGAGKAVTPVLKASGVDLNECDDPDPGSSSSSTSTTSSSTGGSTSGGKNTSGVTGGGVSPDVYVGSDVGCDCSGTADTVEWDDTTVDDSTSDSEVDTYESGDDCSGETTDAGGDNCSGDTSEPASDDCDGGGSESYGGDDCDSGSSGGDDCDSGSSGAEDCDSGSSGAESCDSGGGSSDVDCSGGSSGGECSIAAKGKASKKRSPRLSVMTLGMVAFLAPLRRLGTRRRRSARK